MNLPVQHQDALEQRRNHSRAGCSTPPYQKLTGITKNAAKRQGHPIALHSTITWRASRQPWLQHYKARIATFLTCWDVTSLSCLGESRLILLQSIFHEPIRVFLGFDVVGFFQLAYYVFLDISSRLLDRAIVAPIMFLHLFLRLLTSHYYTAASYPSFLQ